MKCMLILLQNIKWNNQIGQPKETPSAPKIQSFNSSNHDTPEKRNSSSAKQKAHDAHKDQSIQNSYEDGVDEIFKIEDYKPSNVYEYYKIYPSNSKKRITQEERNDSLTKRQAHQLKSTSQQQRYIIDKKWLKNNGIKLGEQLHQLKMAVAPEADSSTTMQSQAKAQQYIHNNDLI